MTKENQKDPRANIAVRFWPWLLGAVMLAVYGFTLNRWVTLLNIGQVAQISGWIWQPQIFSPLTFLITYPFRWLPPAAIPLALNLFSAICAAATLALLARSVALLPHDRTEAERQRERSDFGFLTGWKAWLPPLVAVATVGFQFSFWQHATSFTGETLNLFFFAFILWQLLEYRMDEKENRLFIAAFVYGLSMTENWAMLGFLPVFVMMIIWLRKLEFFDTRFLTRMAFLGLAGTMLFFLLPLAAKFSGKFPLTVWEVLKPALRQDWNVLKAIQDGDVRHTLLLMSLTSLLPLLLLSFRWSSSFGDNSPMGVTLANNLINLIYAALFGVCLWVMFDPPFSPRQLGYGFPNPFYGTPSLTFYYLSAVSIGYFFGYFLLVFSKTSVTSRKWRPPQPVLPPGLLWLGTVIVTATFAVAALAIWLLLYKNAPLIRVSNDDTLLKYASFTTENLPRSGAILLVDSEIAGQSQVVRSYLIQAMLAREGREKDFLVVDSPSLNLAPYHRFLHQRYPDKWPSVVKATDLGGVNPLGLLGLLTQLSKTNDIYYLNPSFGYYFEQFYQEPHGLLYQLKPLTNSTLLPPPLDKNLMAENESFWNRVTPAVEPAITQALYLPDPKNARTLPDRLLKRLHISPESNPNATLTGMFYSRSLDYWGVQLQRANELERAAAQFNAALRLNPDNIAATINLGFNEKLRTGASNMVDSAQVTPDQFGKYRNWNEMLIANGPLDETSFTFENGRLLVQAGLLRQAIAPFTRVRQLAPENLATRLLLAQLYLFTHHPDLALEALNDPNTHPASFGLTEDNSTELNVLTAAGYFQKNDTEHGVSLLESEIDRHPKDDTLLLVTAQFFNMQNLLTNSLHVINRKLSRNPDDAQWLYGKGIVCLKIGNYTDAIAALSRFLELDTNNPDALFNRAFAYLQSDRLDAARADLGKLQSNYTNSFQVAYGLGEIAWRQHATNESIRNYKIYLASAPTNSAEAKTVRERLNQLQSK